MTNIINMHYKQVGQNRQRMQCMWDQNAHKIMTDRLKGRDSSHILSKGIITCSVIKQGMKMWADLYHTDQ